MLTENYIRIILSVVIAIVMLVIIFRFRATKKQGRDSLDILHERYEKGEITKEEYDKAKEKRGLK